MTAISRRASSRQLWVIATRNGKQPARVTIRGLPRWAKNGRLFPGGGKVTAKAGRLTLSLPGWGVRVIRFSR